MAMTDIATTATASPWAYPEVVVTGLPKDRATLSLLQVVRLKRPQASTQLGSMTTFVAASAGPPWDVIETFDHVSDQATQRSIKGDGLLDVNCQSVPDVRSRPALDEAYEPGRRPLRQVVECLSRSGGGVSAENDREQGTGAHRSGLRALSFVKQACHCMQQSGRPRRTFAVKTKDAKEALDAFITEKDANRKHQSCRLRRVSQT